MSSFARGLCARRICLPPIPRSPDHPITRFLRRLCLNRLLTMDLKAIQSALVERGFDAWLFYDHHHRDPIAYRVLGVSESLMVTRRWYYVIPAKGEPHKLVHRIE